MLCRPLRPERTLLRRLLREHLETFLVLAPEGRAGIEPVPRNVETVFRKYLECGVPSNGVARVR